MWDHTNLRWLDLSYNYLTSIEPEILEFRNLKTLYLHGNWISHMKEVVKLSELDELRCLTLHGNPIEQIPGYRMYVIGFLLKTHQTLKKFDTVLITKKERDSVIVWNTRLSKAKLSSLKVDNVVVPYPKDDDEENEGDKKKDDV